MEMRRRPTYGNPPQLHAAPSALLLIYGRNAVDRLTRAQRELTQLANRRYSQ